MSNTEEKMISKGNHSLSYQVIVDRTDANVWTESGNYFIEDETSLHLPQAKSGYLRVLNASTQEKLFQHYEIQGSEELYTRFATKEGSGYVFGEWVEDGSAEKSESILDDRQWIASDSDIQALTAKVENQINFAPTQASLNTAPIVMSELANKVTALENLNSNITVSGSLETSYSFANSISVMGSRSGSASSASGSVTSLTRIAGIAAGTRTLQNLLQELVNKSHTHGAVGTTFNCNCNCNCSD